MNNAVQKKKRNNASLVLMLLADVCLAVSLFMYLRNGTNAFVPELSNKVIILLAVSLVCSVVMTFVQVKLGRYVVFLIALWAWLEYVITEVNYFANLIASIDGSSIDVTVVMIIVLTAAGFILAKISGNMITDWTDVEIVDTPQTDTQTGKEAPQA